MELVITAKAECCVSLAIGEEQSSLTVVGKKVNDPTVRLHAAITMNSGHQIWRPRAHLAAEVDRGRLRGATRLENRIEMALIDFVDFIDFFNCLLYLSILYLSILSIDVYCIH